MVEPQLATKYHVITFSLLPHPSGMGKRIRRKRQKIMG